MTPTQNDKVNHFSKVEKTNEQNQEKNRRFINYGLDYILCHHLQKWQNRQKSRDDKRVRKIWLLHRFKVFNSQGRLLWRNECLAK